MIREEKNALVLVLLFGVGAFVLYFFVLKPALEQAIVPVSANAGDVPPDLPPDPILDQRPKSAKRMLTARALLRDAATGLPLTRVGVKVLGIEDISEPQARDAGGGVYLVEYLPADASFGVEFTLEGYRPRALHLLRGESKATLELGVVALSPERSLHGEVRDEAGKPLPKVRVGAFALPEQAPGEDSFERCRQLAEAIRRAPAAFAETDADGRFRIGPLEPRRYAVHFVRDGFASKVLPRIDLQFADARTAVALDHAGTGRARFNFSDAEPASGCIVTLIEAVMPQDRALSAVQVELTKDGVMAPGALPAIPHFVFVGGGGAASCGFGPFVFPEDRQLKLTLPRGSTLTGSVVDAFKVPIRGARIEARGTTRGAFSTYTTTGADGGYRLEGIPIGACKVRASAPGYASDDQTLPVASFGAEHRAALYRGGILEGVVFAADKPLLGSRITVVGQDLRAVSDEHGRFRIEGLAAGPARIRCDSVGFSTQEKTLAVALGAETRVRFEPTSGGEIRVRVLDGAEAPVRGARVAAYRVRGDDTIDTGAMVATDTDDSGYARLRDLENGGKFVLYASAPGLAPARGEPFVLGPEHLRKGFAFQLERAASVVGRVVTKDGAAIPRAAVRIESRRSDPFERFLLARVVDRVATRSDGSFEIGDLPAGDFQVIVEAVSFRRTVSGKIPLAPGDRYTKVEIKPPPCLPVFGSIENDVGRPAEWARVTLAPPSQKGVGAPTHDVVEATDFAGRFYFFTPDPGATRIHAFAEHVGESEFVLDSESGPPPYRVVLEREAKER